mgnify:CR=1 FL=1
MYSYVLIWHSQYGREEIDSFDTISEANLMRKEYRMAFGEGSITIMKVRR